MNLPENIKLSEEEVLAAIEQVLNSLSYKWTFTYYDVDDLKQEGFILAMKALQSGKYDPSRPLIPFLYTHLKRRFINLKRDKYQRYETPCKSCVFYDKVKDHCNAFDHREECDKWSSWQRRNESKKNIASPIDISVIDVNNEKNMYNEVNAMDESEKQEIFNIIDNNLPISLRESYLRLLYGCKISMKKREEVQTVIIEILREYGYVD